MITTLKITRIWVEQVEKIEAEELRPVEELGYSQRSITIWTTEGEKFELILEAETSGQLEFKKPDDSWLTPKVYKGRLEER